MEYRAEIDGLRAIAVVPVILFHAGIEPFTGGFIGVDVFFVISGYLITTLLVNDIENNKFSIIKFYERRARRILPAMFFVMLFCIPFALQWMTPDQLKDFSLSIVAVSLFISNLFFWRESEYFSTASEQKPMLHTWSLAVEEQYYLLFPIFLIFFWRFGKNRVFWIIVILSAISLMISEWGWRNQPKASFYLAPTRAWELFAGSIAAFILGMRHIKGNNFLSLVGLGGILFSIVYYNESTPFPSFHTLVPVLGTVLIILFSNKETFVAKLLSTKVLVSLGLISYSTYLWHQPLFAFARIRFFDELEMGLGTSLLIFALSIFLGYLTWRFIEKPFRKSEIKAFEVSRTIFVLASLGTLFFVSFGIGTNKYWAKKGYEGEHFNAGCRFSPRGCFENLDATKKVALWGDSYANMFSQSLGKKLNADGISLSTYVLNSCPALIGATRNNSQNDFNMECSAFNEMAFSEISKHKFNIVIINNAYNWYFNGKNDDGSPILIYPPGEDLISSWQRTIKLLSKVTELVIFVTPHPTIEDFNKKLKLLKFSGIRDFSSNYEKIYQLRELMISAVQSGPKNILEINGLEWFCKESDCRILDDDWNTVLFDGSHLSSTFSPSVSDQILTAIQSKNSNINAHQ